MHAVSRPNPPRPICEGRLEVHQVPAWQDNLVWLVASPSRAEAAAVDGPEAAPVLEACERLGLRLTTILNTHTHPDHIGLNAALGDRLRSMRVVGPRARADEIPGLTEGVEDGDRFELFGETVRVMLTEGHIDGHVSYLLGEALFCGDTLFGAGCGYLFDGPPRKMFDSLTRLARLPEETLVFCAHEYTQDNLRFAWSVDGDNEALAERIRETWRIRGEGASSVPSTIGLERRTNPFLRADARSIRAAVAAGFPDRALDDAAEIFAATRALKDRKDYRALPDAELPVAPSA